jgi:hypothetical protein
MKRKALKIISIIFLLAVSFHLSGMEMAFCEDGSGPVKADTHGCLVCHSGHHAANIVQQTAVSSIPDSLGLAPLQFNILKAQDSAFQLLRPPIFA